MAPTDSAVPPTVAGGSVEVLKRVKATETEWDQKLAAARRESEERIARLRDENAATLKAALAEAEAERARTLERARVDTGREVATILTEGEQAAAAAARVEGKRPRDQRNRVLAVVLGSLAAD